MVMSLARMSAGCGYEYFTKHTARGDAPDRASTGLVDYYIAAGYPAGVWLGAGLSGLGDGAGLTPGGTVSDEQMARLFGAGRDPVTDRPLGRGYLTPEATAPRTSKVEAPAALEIAAGARKAAATPTPTGGKAGRARQPVAGFDMTFSVPKSVSTLWALADEHTRQAIVDARHAAVAATFALAETEVARTRTGFGGHERVPVRGLIAAAFDHHDSRAGDPQLHTHVTVANRVQTLSGRWQTLDSRTLYSAAVALSETYDVLLASNITRALGLNWEMRRRGRDRNPRRELAAIPDRLIAEFSQRSAAITVAKDAAIAEFTAEHGGAPTANEAIRIRQRATLATRQNKHVVPLDE